MKAVALLLGLAASSSANIIFTHVELTCYNNTKLYNGNGCLRGQDCNSNNHCVPSEKRSLESELQQFQERQAPPFSTDGTCGPAHGDTICDPNSKAYTGGCCSQYGWCGNTPQHCGDGCISGCTPNSPPPANPGNVPRADGRCGKDFGGSTCDPKGPYGGCCSQFGYCGSTPGHCLVANGCQNGCTDGSGGNTGGSLGGGAQPSTTAEPVIGGMSTTMAPGVAATGAATTDGTCGAGNGNTVCGNWPNGNCCSMYGFCGNTDAHCGAGCQSGNCLGGPAVLAPDRKPAPAAPNGGSFIIVGDSGVPPMHAALMPNGRVVFLDKLENYTKLRTANGYYAMSSEYDPQTNQPVALAYSTNAFCSGGAFLADGRVVNVGGNGPLSWLDPNIGDGFTAIRYLQRSSSDASLNGQDWKEPGNKLSSPRWYASAQTMPDGTVFVASGSLNGLNPTVLTNNNPTYEILSPDGVSQGNSIPMDILVKNQPYYMYPFIHLLRDGTLFVFVSKASQIFSVGSNTIVKELPDLPGDYRTYPNTGGSVLLPLSSANNWSPDIIICGGGAYQDITSPTDPSCGRIQPLSANPQWEMDAMPEGRGMVEGTLLPDGTIVWLNGGSRGAQGFGLMAAPAYEALLYDPAKPLGQRWSTLASSSIARLYHSVALLLLDGTIMVAGSNPVEMPKLQPDAADPFVTEFRVESYIPPYLQGERANQRPTNVAISSKTVAPGGQFDVSFQIHPNALKVEVVLYHGGFVTHSVHMGHRMIKLDVAGWAPGATNQHLTVSGPPNYNVSPPGPYVVYVLCDGTPGIGQFVQVV